MYHWLTTGQHHFRSFLCQSIQLRSRSLNCITWRWLFLCVLSQFGTTSCTIDVRRLTNRRPNLSFLDSWNVECPEYLSKSDIWNLSHIVTSCRQVSSCSPSYEVFTQRRLRQNSTINEEETTSRESSWWLIHFSFIPLWERIINESHTDEHRKDRTISENSE